MDPFSGGLDRVRRMESNNRRSAAAKSRSARTPRKPGARRGFASNPTSGASIGRVSARGGMGRKGPAGRVRRSASGR